MNRSLLLSLWVTLLVASACSDAPTETTDEAQASLMITNARVYTLNWGEPARDGTIDTTAPRDERGWHPDADTIVIDGDTIVYVGAAVGATQYRENADQIIDLDGATVIPGLIDSHTHVFNLGERIDRVDLTQVETEEAAVALIAARAGSTPDGEWIVGLGWDEGAWADNYPDKILLSAAVPDHPVVLRGLHGFADWVNQKALDFGGITAATPVPVGGEMRLGDDGEPNGLFLNRATELFDSRMPEPSDLDLRRRALLGLEQMARDGYVAVHDAGLDANEMATLAALEADGALPIRVNAMLSLRDEPLMRRWIEQGPDEDVNSRLVTRTVKAYYDGALGSRGARLLEDYSDMPGHRGVSGDDYGFDEALMAEAVRAGFQVAIHAIGDAGNREALDILERIVRDHPESAKLRHRIEHAQVIHPDDLPRVGALGLIASMEPPHAMEDKAWAEQRLGPERIKGAYAWRSLRQHGAMISFNSDNPGSDHDIFYGLHSAVVRQDKNLQPEGGWYANEALTMDETLRAYTLWSAYASFRETKTGMIAPGRWADLTVIDIDPFVTAEENPNGLLGGTVLMTIVGGDIVFDGRR